MAESHTATGIEIFKFRSTGMVELIDEAHNFICDADHRGYVNEIDFDKAYFRATDDLLTIVFPYKIKD